jgi:hypothetical protein
MIKPLKGIWIFFLCLPAVFTVGCYSTRHVVTELDQWIGKTKTELIKSWGSPSQVKVFESKGEKVVYTASAKAGRGSQYSGSANNYITNYNTYVNPDAHTSSTKETTFYISPSGIIYQWKYMVDGVEINAESIKKKP